MYLLFVALGFASSLLSSVFGFGSAIIVLAIGPYILPAHHVVVLSAILFGASTLTKTLLFRAHLQWKLVACIAIGSLPFAYVGGRLLPLLSAEALRLSLGTMILGYVALKVLAATPTRLYHHTSNPLATPSKVRAQTTGKMQLVAIAAGYGFTSGLVGSGSVIKALFFREAGLGKEAFVGTMAATSVLATLGKLIAYIHSGLFITEFVLPAAGLVVAAFTAALAGKFCLQRIDSSLFDSGVNLLLVIAGVGLLL